MGFVKEKGNPKQVSKYLCSLGWSQSANESKNHLSAATDAHFSTRYYWGMCSTENILNSTTQARPGCYFTVLEKVDENYQYRLFYFDSQGFLLEKNILNPFISETTMKQLRLT